MPDLFGFEPPIAWDDAGREGVTRDGRRVTIESSPLFQHRFVATIPLHGRDVATRRSRITVEECRRDAERAVMETMR